MEHAKFLLLAILVLLGTSCSQDEPTNEDLLIGQWALTEATLNGTVTFTDDDIDFVMTQIGQNNNSDHTIEFMESGIYEEDGAINLSIDYFQEGQLLFSEDFNSADLGMDQMSNSTGDWEFDGDILLLDREALEYELSESRLVIDFSPALGELPGDEIGLGGELNIDMDIQLVYTKK